MGEHRVHHGLLVLELPVHVRETLYPDDVPWIRYHRLRNCGGVLPTAVSHPAPGQSTIINYWSTKLGLLNSLISNDNTIEIFKNSILI